MCLEKVWVIPISSKCCRKILSEKWKINPFFQFCSWHIQPSKRTKRLVSWPFSPHIKLNLAEGGKYLVWFGVWPAASAGYDDTWRWRGWAGPGRDIWIISVPLDIVFLSPGQDWGEENQAVWCRQISGWGCLAWPGLALNTGGQFAVFISVISNYSARITRTTGPALLPDATQAMEQSHQSYQSLFRPLKNSLKSKVCP